MPARRAPLAVVVRREGDRDDHDRQARRDRHLARRDRRETGRSLVVAGVVALWAVDVLYAYYGDVYKRRRLQVRTWIDALPRATETELASWKTPANPFDGLARSEKISALAGTIASPAVSGIYVLLLVVTLAFAAI
jgi:hypothetical protein